MSLMQCNQITSHLPWQKYIYLVFLYLIFSPLVCAEIADDSQTQFVQPIINAQNTQTDISRNGLSAIFKMRLRQWADGEPVTVFVLEDENPVHKQFSKQILNVFPHQFRRIWNKAVFSGSGQAPITLMSVEEMKEKIANTPGSIGYLSPDQLDDRIKILDIR